MRLTFCRSSARRSWHLEGRGGRVGLYANHLACRTQERIFLRQGFGAVDHIGSRGRTSFVSSLLAFVCWSFPMASTKMLFNLHDASEPIVGFIGTYSYAPNLQSAIFLAEQVFPHVRAACPDALLRIAGANMPESAMARLQRLPRVEILGQVVDSGRFMDECAVLALPVFLRGGVPLKLVEAMARGKAIVASPELVSGVDITDGENALDPKQAAKTSPVRSFRCCGIASLRERLGSSARATFVAGFLLLQRGGEAAS